MPDEIAIRHRAHSEHPSARASWRAGRFDAEDYAAIKEILRRAGFSDSTILKAAGIWHGQEEDAVQIIILAIAGVGEMVS